MANIPSIGMRPVFRSPDCAGCTRCLSICPGAAVEGSHNADGLHSEIGSALEVWEGHSTDPEIRHRAASGGAISAVTLYCIEREGMKFALHAAEDPATPWVNRTVTSDGRAELVARSGSRYSPSSPCDRLKAIEESDGPCVFIGKPCDTAAVAKLRKQRPQLDRRLGVVISFFCAGTPSSQGTLDLLKHHSVEPARVSALRYRGEGWPGEFTVHHQGSQSLRLSYSDSWGYLSRYKPLRCNLCPDGLGQAADLSFGDAWQKHSGNGEQGISLVIVRTELGRQILRRAMEAGYVQLERVDGSAVLRAQPGLLQRRRELFGRLAAMTVLGLRTPRFPGFALLRAWVRQPFSVQVRSVLGTLRRAIVRNWWRGPGALSEAKR